MHPGMRKLLMEAFLYLGWARLLKALPFSRVAPTLGNQMEETSFESDREHDALLKSISKAILIMSRYTFWESKCLVMAIAGKKMLSRRRIDSTLYLGMAKDDSGKLIAHAWLRSGHLYITGAEGIERFTVVRKFGRRDPEINPIEIKSSE